MGHTDALVLQQVRDAVEINYGTDKHPIWRRVRHVTQWNTLPSRKRCRI